MAIPRPEVERVTETLREQIVEGLRPPGSRLVERDLAAELGVSRVPVREALRNLVGEGLAVPRPRTWMVVREFTDRDVADLMEVRASLDTLTVRRAAQRREPAQVRRLGELVTAARNAARAGDSAGAHRLGAEFHEQLTVMADNSVLRELSEVTRSRMRWLLGQHADLVEMVNEHAAIHAAVADGDADHAAWLTERHLSSSQAAVGRFRARRRE